MKRIQLLLLLLICMCIAFGSIAFASDPPLSCSQLQFGGSFNGCRDYSGSGWTIDNAGSDCGNGQGSKSGVLKTGDYCDRSGAVGVCVAGKGTENETRLYFYNGDQKTLKSSCANYMQGEWEPVSIDTGGDGQSSDAGDADIMKEAAGALAGDDKVAVAPDGCDEEKLNTLVKERNAIEFTPQQNAAAKGLIIYPGAGIDPRAYAVAARMIAENGFFVAIVPFPGNAPDTDPMRADDIIQLHPEITDWAIAGHDSGGAAAAVYADADPLGKIKAIAFWGAYPPESVDLYRSGLKGLSIRGTLDGILNTEKWKSAQDRLPSSTYIAEMNGGNHSQFGYCADQAGDLPAKISREYQHQLFTGATVHLLNRIHASNDKTQTTNLFSTGIAAETINMGKEAQRIIAGLKAKDLRKNHIANKVVVNQNDFQSAKPSFPENGFALVDIFTHSHQMANQLNVSSPPIYEGELWIKMKSQAAFVDEYGFEPEAQGQYGCEQVNKEIFNYALNIVRSIDRETYFKYRRANVAVAFVEDFKALTGPGWLDQPVVLKNVGQTEKYSLQSPRLEVQTTMPEPLGGCFYCKVWSPVAAYNFIADRANQR